MWTIRGKCATLWFEIEIKSVLCQRNINKLTTSRTKRSMGKRFIFVCDGILMYGERVVIRGALKKMNIKRFAYTSSDYNKDESFCEKLCFLAKYGQRIRRKCKILQRLCHTSKCTTSEIYPLVKDGQTLVKLSYRFCRSNKGKILFNIGRHFLKMTRGDEMLKKKQRVWYN